MTPDIRPSWLAFSLIVLAVAMLAVFDQMCRPPRPVTLTEATATPTLVRQVTVLPTLNLGLPATVTPTVEPTRPEQILAPAPTFTPTATSTPSPTATVTPVVPMRQRG